MKPIKICSIFFAFAIILCGCSNNEIASIQAEADQYKKRIEALEIENRELQQKLTPVQLKQGSLTLNYIEGKDKRRFVEQEVPLLLIPQVDAQVLNKIEPNTVVEVQDFVEVNQEVWLYVTMPVFDTPANMKGWIKEPDTQLYTVETQSKVKSPITLKEGTNVYKVNLFTEIQGTETTKTEVDQTCILSDEQEQFVALSCAGGASFIVKKSDIFFPPVE
ncbi:hypothetical protein [Bacillus suaedaesalsae]|uniref:Lipoprotein n=1 Tax=Bacillus suaedaesalsae TaxID=2810349 RepID=A0ABS2DLR2_9BACI|nr:hypothetical protein [Bacillus suaedaesalsae]MBM6619435.1 hypothetical protein [Bacillus suaedaesalsae]